MTSSSNTLPSHKHILVWCRTCKKHEVIETPTAHYCSKECSKNYFKTYWKKAWLKRKNDPVAKEHARKASKAWRARKKAAEQRGRTP